MAITILGAGEIGRGIAASLRPGQEVFLWDKTPVQDQKPLEEIIPKSDLLFFCLPTAAIEQALELVKRLLQSKAVIISLSKGVDPNTGKFSYEIFNGHLQPQQYALLSGPMLAEELAKGSGAAAVLASANPEVMEKLQAVFRAQFLRLEFSKDLRSVALASVLKNVYALMLGMSDGLGFGSNIKGFLVSRILPETEIISEILGIDHKIIIGTAGLGDFIATAFSSYSANHEAGMELVLGGVVPQSEGLVALPFLLKLLPNRDKLQMLGALEAVIIARQNPKIVFERLIYGND